MSETLKTIAVLVSASIASIAFIYYLILKIIAIIKKIKDRKAKRLLAKDEKKRIEKEKEIAYKLYLEAKKADKEIK